jgi:ABC-2 type transport system permease protein
MRSLAGALLYLRAMTLIGMVRSRLRRLKQPKYLAGAAVGIAYLYFVLFRRFSGQPPGGMRSGTGASGVPQVMTPELLVLIAGLGAAALFIALFLSWVIPRRPALSFGEAEIAFLFPAPVSRRMLIHYRLLSSQFGLALTALVLSVVFRRGGGMGGTALTHAVGWWVILATINLHFTGSSFVISKVLNPSITLPARRNLIIATAAIVVLALVVWASLTISGPEMSDLMRPRTVMRYVRVQLDRGPLPWLLAIPRLVIAPYLATGMRSFITALGPALLILVLHYFWVMRTEVAFEEASIARAEKRAARRRAVQQGDFRPNGNARKAQREPFKLAGAGRPEIAFLWKNLLSTSAILRPRGMAIFVAIVVAISLWIANHPSLAVLRVMAVPMASAFAVMLLILGPQLARQDLRSDLMNSDMLKTYPLKGWQIVLGELLTPIVILSMLTWLLLIVVALTFPDGGPVWLTPTLRTAALIGVGVLIPPFCAIQLLVPNAFTVIFPAWVQTVSNRREHGLEVLGQRIIFFAGQMLIIGLALVPAAIGAGIVFVVVQFLFGPLVGLALGVAAAFALLALEAWAGIDWLGQRFERFDLSAELRP